MTDEIRTMNNILKAIDGKTKRTFAYLCGDTKIHDTSYINGLKNDFVAARGVKAEMLPINKIGLYNIGCYMINGQSGNELIALVKQAIASHTLLVFLFHGVGGEHSLNVSLPAHSQLLHFLKQNEKENGLLLCLKLRSILNNINYRINKYRINKYRINKNYNDKNNFTSTPVVIFVSHAYAQFQQGGDTARRRQVQDSIRMLTEKDHQNMMDQLHITSLRPGANGSNPNATNAANYDETKANPYPNLPDALTLKNGRKVTTAKMWWDQRRPEIAENFDREVYGRVPKNTPKVNWEVVKDTMEMNGNFQVHTRRLLGHVDISSYPQGKVDIQVNLSTPVNAKAPVPVIMEFGFVFPPGFRFPTPPLDTTNRPQAPAAPTWQQQLLAKGWGYAVLFPNSIQADNGAGLTQGIIGLMNKGQYRKPEDWGSLRAWAWGASRALDYLKQINPLMQNR